MTSTEEIREKVARIIDPSSWQVLDSYLAETLRKYAGQHAGYDPDAFKHKASLAKADAILSLLSLSPLPEGFSSRPGPIDGADNVGSAVASAGAGDAATQAFEALSKAANTILALVTAKVGRALYEAPEEDLVPLMATYGVELPAKLFRMLFDAADPELIASPPADPAMGNRSPLPAPDAGAVPGLGSFSSRSCVEAQGDPQPLHAETPGVPAAWRRGIMHAVECVDIARARKGRLSDRLAAIDRAVDALAEFALAHFPQTYEEAFRLCEERVRSEGSQADAGREDPHRQEDGR